jgi:putative tricarboxylic transport membrane protein
MKKNDRFASLFWTALGFYIAYEGYRLQLGTLQEPKPGFLVFWAGMILSGLSLALFTQTFWVKKDEPRKVLWIGVRWPKVVKLTVALLLYILIFKWAGFLLSTFVLLLFLLKGLEPQKWSVALVVSLVTVVLVYVLFGILLESQFPEGILGKMLNRFLSSVMT